eukprot:8052718-Karenia_brevis.AAC.1
MKVEEFMPHSSASSSKNEECFIGDCNAFALGIWVRKVQSGQKVPKADEALRMIHEMKENIFQERLAALEASIDWIPTI